MLSFLTMSQMDYTGVEKDSPCFRCTIPSLQNCTCDVTFSLKHIVYGKVFEFNSVLKPDISPSMLESD